MPKETAELLLEDALRHLKRGGHKPSSRALRSIRQVLKHTIKLTDKDPDTDKKVLKVMMSDELAFLKSSTPEGFDWELWAKRVSVEKTGVFNRGHVLRELERQADESL